MNLSCLTCDTLQRTNSDLDDEPVGTRFQRSRPTRSDQFRSGPLLQGSSEDSETKHKRGNSTAAVMENIVKAERLGKSEPRLVRSPGIRRDWSFEDLTKKNSSIASRA